MFLVLNLILAKKQKFGKYNISIGELKQINIKKRSYDFYNDIIDLDEFDGSKIKLDKKKFNDIDICYRGSEYKKKLQNVMK